MSARSKRTWGGPRRGAGRKPGPLVAVRRNRVTTTLTDAELRTLERMAEDRGLPTGTMLYELVKLALHRRKR